MLNDEDDDEEDDYEQEEQDSKETKPTTLNHSVKHTQKYNITPNNNNIIINGNNNSNLNKQKITLIPTNAIFIKDTVPNFEFLKLRDLDIDSYSHVFLKKNQFIDINEYKVLQCYYLKIKKNFFSKTKLKQNKGFVLFDEGNIYVLRDKEFSKQNIFLKKVKDCIKLKLVLCVTIESSGKSWIEISIEYYANDVFLINEKEQSIKKNFIFSEENASIFINLISFYINQEQIKNYL